MGHRSTIWKNRLEGYVMNLFTNERKTFVEIAETVQKDKKIPLSSEAVRNFINKQLLQENTQKNTV